MKLFLLFVISAILFFFTQGAQILQELAAFAVLGLGIDYIISEIKKPISH